jgi:hypothetical protein
MEPMTGGVSGMESPAPPPVNRSSSDEYSKDKSFAYRKNDFQESLKIPIEVTAYFPPIYQDFSSSLLTFFVILLKNLSAPIN